MPFAVEHPTADWNDLLGRRLPELVTKAERDRLKLLSSRIPSNEKLYVHGHPEICFLLEGELVIESSESTDTFASGTVLIVAPGTYHFPRSREHSALTVWFAGAVDHMTGVLSRTFREGHWISLGGLDLLGFPEGRKILDDTIQELSGTEPGNVELARANILALCVHALRNMTAGGGDDQAGERLTRVEEIAREARRFIRGNYVRPLTLTDVAHHVALSPNYLANLFNRQFGTTVRQYLTEVRIEEAKKLLTGTNRSISEIAYAVGYHSPFYFSRAFRSTADMSPSEFREASGKENPPSSDQEG